MHMVFFFICMYLRVYDHLVFAHFHISTSMYPPGLGLICVSTKAAHSCSCSRSRSRSRAACKSPNASGVVQRANSAPASWTERASGKVGG